MEKKSAYPSPRGENVSQGPNQQPQSGPPYDVPVPKGPGLMESFFGGMQSGKKYKGNISAQEWSDMKLTPDQWMGKYQSNWRTYKNWINSVHKRQRSQSDTSVPMNWLQKSIWPLKIPGIK